MRWLRRDRALEAFLATSRRWQREAAEWDMRRELERLERARVTQMLSEHLGLKMYRIKADMRREVNLLLFGDKPLTKLEGLINAIMKAEYAPKMGRAMNEPNPLMQRLFRGT